MSARVAAARTLAYAEQGLGLLRPGERPVYRLLAHNAVARSHMQAGATHAAAEALHQALLLMTQVPAPIASLQAHHHLGHLRMIEGRLRTDHLVHGDCAPGLRWQRR